MSSVLVRFALGFAIVLSPAASSALNLDYQFDSTNSPDGAPLFNVAARATFPNGNRSETEFEFALDDWVLPLHAIISDDRQSARLEATAFTFTGTPQILSGAWDLGFSGSVPFTVTLTAFSVSLPRADVALAPNGSFRLFRQTGLTIQGVVEALGTTTPFAVSGSTVFYRYSGKFTPGGSFLDLTLVEDSVTPTTIPVEFFAGSVPGIDLALRAFPDWVGTRLTARAVVPEPTTAALLAIGLAVLATRPRA